MATNNVDLFSYLPGLEVTADEVLECELLAYQTIQAKFPDLDLREGTGLRDLVIRPAATLLALTNKALVYYFSQNSLSDATDDTPTVFVDKMLSNWFITRNQGSNAIINARLYFAKSKVVTLTTDTFFSPDNVLKFFPAANSSFPASQLTFDSGSNQYYLDVDLVAEQTGDTYNLSSGSLIYFTSFDPYFLHAEINFLRTQATNAETNTEFIARTKTAISTRNLINIPSITNNLLADFPLISGVTSIGYGDPEMIRDEVQVLAPGISLPFWIHIGGKTDIYCKVPLTNSILQFTTDSNGDIYLTGAFYKVVRSSISGGDSADTIGYGVGFTISNPNTIVAYPSITSSGTTATVTLVNHGLSVGERFTISGAAQNNYNGTFKVVTVPNGNTFTYALSSSASSPATGSIVMTYVSRANDFGFSDNQTLKISFGPNYAGMTASFNLSLFEGLDGIQAYLTDPSRRVLCADPLARGYNLTQLDVTVSSYTNSAADTTVCTTVIQNYLNSLEPGQVFIMADLLSLLYAAGVKTIQTPLTITFVCYKRDLFTTTTGTIVDAYDPLDSLNIFTLNSVTTNVIALP